MKIYHIPAQGVIQGIVNFLKQDSVFRNKGISIYHSVRSIADPVAQRDFEVWAGDLWYAMDAHRWLGVAKYDIQDIEGEMATYRFIDCAIAALVVYFIGV